MRLYLSSYQLGDHPEVLSRMVGGASRGWVTMNALDGLDDERRRIQTTTQIDNLAALGLEAEDLDLRDIRPPDADAALAGRDFLWVRGGNVFTLRMAMARSGIDRAIVDGLDDDRFVYAGFSAGPCVLAPDLHGLEICDPVDTCIATYGAVRFDGLSVLDRPVVPHLDSPEHPATDLLREVADHYDREGRPYWALRDGQALVIDGDDIRVF